VRDKPPFLRGPLLFGVIAATIEMAVLLWLVSC
jgi:hypothetical protein